MDDETATFVIAGVFRTGILLGYLAAHVMDCPRTDSLTDLAIIEGWEEIDRHEKGPHFIEQARSYIETSPVYAADREKALRVFEAIIERW